MLAVLIAVLSLTVPTLIWLGCEFYVRQRRTPPGLSRDWWPEFERDFRTYARQRTTPQGPGGGTRP